MVILDNGLLFGPPYNHSSVQCHGTADI